MDIKKLFSGIAVIIDDDINDESKNIYNILKQINKKNIPYVSYDKLPDEALIDNLQSTSFILLDWKLVKGLSVDDVLSGVKYSEKLEKQNDEENIKFLKKIQEKCFCPVFIFTDEEVGTIKEKLQNAKIYKEGKCNNILIKAKSEIDQEESLFTALEDWLKKTAPMYLLKKWDYSYQTAKSRLFIDFQQRSPDWVKILWRTYAKEDNVNPSIELGELINRNIHAQMMPLELDSSVFDGEATSSYKEVVSCLKGQCFIDAEYLEKDIPNTGDLFEDNGIPYINIRPCCDLILRTEGGSATDIELYLLKGESKEDKNQIKPLYSKKYGSFDYRESSFMVFPLYKDHLVDFKFKELVIKKWSEMKSKRKGCLLPPFLTELQIKYGAFVQRQGLPRFPKDLFMLSDS